LYPKHTNFLQPTGGILLLHDRKAGEPVELLEIKSRKPAPKPATAGQTLTPQEPAASAAVDILNTEDDDGTEDAPVPDPFEYETDTEEL
jgi:26S proteasome regulatory subunit N2